MMVQHQALPHAIPQHHGHLQSPLCCSPCSLAVATACSEPVPHAPALLSRPLGPNSHKLLVSRPYLTNDRGRPSALAALAWLVGGSEGGVGCRKSAHTGAKALQRAQALCGMW